VGEGESYRCDADKGLFQLGSSVFGELKREKQESQDDGDVHAKCLDLGGISSPISLCYTNKQYEILRALIQLITATSPVFHVVQAQNAKG
jgi:hypothetical protein